MFLTIEGIDGAGKTTLCDELQRLLPEAVILKKKELLRHSPITIRSQVARLYEEIWSGASERANLIKDREFSDILLMAGWFHLIDMKVLQPNLTEGNIVIIDGWYYKFLARFWGRSHDELELLNRVLVGLTDPSIGVYLDLDPEAAAERKITFTESECGVLDGYEEINEANFISYQRKQKIILDEFATRNQWRIYSSKDATPTQLALGILEDTKINHLTKDR